MAHYLHASISGNLIKDIESGSYTGNIELGESSYAKGQTPALVENMKKFVKSPEDCSPGIEGEAAFMYIFHSIATVVFEKYYGGRYKLQPVSAEMHYPKATSGRAPSQFVLIDTTEEKPLTLVKLSLSKSSEFTKDGITGLPVANVVASDIFTRGWYWDKMCDFVNTDPNEYFSDNNNQRNQKFLSYIAGIFGLEPRIINTEREDWML